MNEWQFIELLGEQGGLTGADAYNTAWVALVPDLDNPARPQWPEALALLRRLQLADGGWGEPHVYYAHERTIATLAAMLTLLTWGDSPASPTLQRAVAALHRYAGDLASESHEPIGFELLLPRLAVNVESFGIPMPDDAWSSVESMAAEKIALIGQLKPDYARPRSWWFSLEMLLPYQLASFDDRLLNRHGSVVISPAATAGYLRALRLHGRNSPRAAAFLERVVSLTGGAGVCYPIEGFEVIWTIDNYLRAGAKPTEPSLAALLAWLRAYWHSAPHGLSHSQAFPIPDGDDTAVGYQVLAQAGENPADAPLLRFWDETQRHFFTYKDERTMSLSAVVHAVGAFRQRAENRNHDRIAGLLMDWIKAEMDSQGELRDKWHISPLYPTTRLLPALLGWEDHFADRLVDYILKNQLSDGGWGCQERSNLEETSLAILGLTAAHNAGRLADNSSLRRAAAYLASHRHQPPRERLWIGKALYQPVGVVKALVRAADLALANADLLWPRPSITAAMPRPTTTGPLNWPHPGRVAGTL